MAVRAPDRPFAPRRNACFDAAVEMREYLAAKGRVFRVRLMRLPILIVFMLVTGGAVAALSASAGLGAAAIALRVVAAMVLIQAVYFAALVVFARLSAREAKKPKGAAATALKPPSPQ